MDIAQYIDHTLLKAVARSEDVEQLCREAVEYGFASVCVNSCWVPLASRLLQDSGVAVCTVVGFPLGAAASEAKAAEAALAVQQGAGEIDMVMNIGWLKSGMQQEVQDDISAVRAACPGAVLKVIIETCYLTDDEKRIACRCAVAAGADFVKTSTGFGTGGAIREDLELMLAEVGDAARVKASGGVRDRETAEDYIQLGVARLGTSSGVALAGGSAATEGY
ncbi:deoxyribose-phosphate aldolase [Spirochaeta africana]|uniref:Deoxyribose-phosphate aldolase n=1 Tax=Spirochaeta africana (strain ATCC 700263 / DSM 8902 / Z-7692) TaxID=889378 RepID=H9UIC7_SPIAZ|nr:deoxyribose-phosphate aldolase [Spirochaeta africana]AFG37270.1 deoxyribose-phosphate aldolase [Spirochaeta africana DSM 8902]